RVESVAWAAERKDVLSALFWMLTLAAYVWYTRRGGIWRYLCVVGAMALGLMAKLMLVTLPLVLLILDFWPLNRVSGARGQVSGAGAEAAPASRFTFHVSRFSRLVLEKIPLFTLALASCVVTFAAQQHGKSIALNVPFTLRAANALNSYAAYVGKMFWPADLAVLYPF